MAYCKNCGKEIGEAKFCPECGTPSNDEAAKTAAQDQPVPPSFQTQNVPPTPGQAWQPPRKKRYGCLIAFLVFLGIAVFSVVMVVKTIGDQPSRTQSNTLNQIISVTKASNDKAQILEDILDSCEIEPVTMIYDQLLDHDSLWGYRIQTKEGANVIMYTTHDHQMDTLKYADYYLYQNGEQLLKLSDFTMTIDEKSDVQYASQEAIKSILKSPSTAKFPSINEWNIWKTPDEIVAQSYVDSQNSFGAELRSEFQIKFTLDGTITSCIFDGEELIP